MRRHDRWLCECTGPHVGVIDPLPASLGILSRIVKGCLCVTWSSFSNLFGNRLEGSWFYREVYSKAMGTNLVKLFKSHVPVLETFSPSILTPFIPKILSLKSPTLIDVDEHMVRNAGGPAPDFPFPTALKYYEWACSHRRHVSVRQDPLILTIKNLAVRLASASQR